MTRGLGLVLVLCGASPAFAEGGRIAVLDMRAKLNVKPELTAALTDSLITEVRRRSGVKVIGSDEVRQMLTFHTTKQQLGCDDTACLAEIGGALGADQLVTTTLSRFGETYLLTLRLIDVRHASVIRDASEQSGTSSDESALALVSKGVAELFPGGASALVPSTSSAAVADVESSASEPQKKTHTKAIVLWSIAGALVATSIVGAYYYADFNAVKSQSLTGTVPISQGITAHDDAITGEMAIWTAGPTAILLGFLGWHAW